MNTHSGEAGTRQRQYPCMEALGKLSGCVDRLRELSQDHAGVFEGRAHELADAADRLGQLLSDANERQMRRESALRDGRTPDGQPQ